jgi:hypothetical protein
MTPPDTFTPRRFSQEWWIEGIRTFLWVALITVLIWVYADMKFTDTRKFSTVLVLRADKADLELLDRERVNVMFEAQGSRESLDRLERQLGSQIELDVSDLGQGERSVPTQEMLYRVGELAQAGVRFISTNPQVVTIHLDRRIKQDVPVVLDAVGAELAKPAEIRPPQVTIWLAESTWERLRDKLGQEEACLRTFPMDLTRVPPGVPQKRMVDVNPVLADQKVRVWPQQVEVEFQVLQATASRAYTVNVRLQFPHTWVKDNVWLEYEFQPQDDFWWRKEITVSGPKQSLDQLKSEDIDAYIQLTDEDRSPLGGAASWWSKPVQVRFAPGMNLRLEGERPTVSFKLVRRAAPPLAAPPALPPAAPLTQPAQP